MGGGGTAALRGSCQALAQTLPCSAPNAGVLPRAKHTLLSADPVFLRGAKDALLSADPVFLRGAKDALLRVLHGGHTGPPRREKVAGSIPPCMGGVPPAHPPHPGSTHASQGEKGRP